MRKETEKNFKKYIKHLEEQVETCTKELRDTQEKLLQQERIFVLGQLVQGMAHELRTPLGAIKNAAYFLNMVLESPDEDVREAIQILDREVNTSGQIINILLDFAHPRAALPRKVDLDDIFQAALSSLSIPGDVEVIKDFDENLTMVWVDPGQLKYVFRNLIVNAIQAMPEGGRLTLMIKAHSPQHVAISIMDTGVGIANQNLRKIFEPLYTTRAKGMGLGLSLAEIYIKGSDGTIIVESELGLGSTFKIILPTVR